MKITNLIVRDIRFPTSLQQDGSDALNQGGYSATYAVLETVAFEFWTSSQGRAVEGGRS